MARTKPDWVAWIKLAGAYLHAIHADCFDNSDGFFETWRAFLHSHEQSRYEVLNVPWAITTWWKLWLGRHRDFCSIIDWGAPWFLPFEYTLRSDGVTVFSRLHLLTHACRMEKRDSRFIQELLKVKSIDINACSDDGQTAIQLGLQMGRSALVSMLLARPDLHLPRSSLCAMLRTPCSLEQVSIIEKVALEFMRRGGITDRLRYLILHKRVAHAGQELPGTDSVTDRARRLLGGGVSFFDCPIELARLVVSFI